MESAAVKRDLDLTINQRLNVNFTDREEGATHHARKSLTMVEKDISSFARFLSQNLCLEVLLFWKEVEQFKTMFSAEERVALFSKIYDLYCVPGAHWQVNFKGMHVENMKKLYTDGKLPDDVPEEVFDDAQQEVYELMRLDLFPRFNEHLAEVASQGETAEVVAESIKQVLSGTNPPATRSFTRFTREQLCEEALLFWIEANDFALLFQPLDQQTRAQAIYDTYMGPKAKFKVSVSDRIAQSVAEALEKKEVTNAIFVTAQREVSTFLEQDVFPRYEKWVSEQGTGDVSRKTDASALIDEKRIGDRGAMRDALKALIDIPEELDAIRVVAQKLDAAEALEFFVDCKKYSLLFNDQDRRETADRLWFRYIDVKADRLINLPDHITRKLQKEILENKSADQKLFEAAAADVLNLMTDNIYPAYVKEKQGVASAPAPTASQAKPPSGGGGGCCMIS